MTNYETIVILSPELTEDEIQNTTNKIETMINSNGEVETKEDWGLRKLAYPIQKKQEGHYLLYSFKSNPDFIDELNRVYNITDEIIKHIIVKKD